jgi:hypothetical protein
VKFKYYDPVKINTSKTNTEDLDKVLLQNASVSAQNKGHEFHMLKGTSSKTVTTFTQTTGYKNYSKIFFKDPSNGGYFDNNA